MIDREFPYGRPSEGKDVLWRAEAKRYSIVLDPDADLYGVSGPHLELRWFPVLKRTPKGAWIATDFYFGVGPRPASDTDKLVILTRNKAFARSTIEEAVRDLGERRKRQLKILAEQTRRAQEDLDLATSSKAAPL